MSKRYDKLVRDRIPDVVEASSEKPVTHVADETEYRRRLGEKLLEEAQEFVAASDDESGDNGENDSDGENGNDGSYGGLTDESLEELTDVLEVIDAICALEGISREQLEEIQREKRDRRGGFRERIVLERVEEVDEVVSEASEPVDET